MYSKTKHSIKENTISFAGLAVILIIISGSVSANCIDPSVKNVYPENGEIVCGNITDFTCNVTKGLSSLSTLKLYVNASLIGDVDNDSAYLKGSMSASEGINTFENVNVDYGYNEYYCRVYDGVGGEGASLIRPFTVEKRCEDCVLSECTGCCPPGLVCSGIGEFCECVPESTTTTTIQETTTTTTVPDRTTTTTVPDRTTTTTVPDRTTTTTVPDRTTTTTVPETTTSIPAVPEFTSLTVALIILLTTPAFAYLIVKRRTD